MNISPIEAVVNNQNHGKSFNRIQAEPISAKYNLHAQKVFGNCFKGHCYNVIGKAMGLPSVW